MVKQAATKPNLQYESPDILDFDPTNPRFGGLMKDASQDDIQKALMAEPYYAGELIDSLLANGFIDYEPLVVKRNGVRYMVVEGNRRLAAIREIRSNLAKYEGRKSDLDAIPVLVFPEKPDAQQQNEMRVYLGVRHLLGFRQWPPLSKAEFLERETAAAGGLDAVIKEMRISKGQARRFLVPYRLLKEAKLKISDGEDFWMLGEALQRAGIKKFVQLDVDDELKIKGYDKKALALLLAYLYGVAGKGGVRDAATRIVHDTRSLSRLAQVLNSEPATTALKAGKSLDVAEIYVDTREESLKRLSKVTKSLGLLVGKLVKGKRDDDSKRLSDGFKEFDKAAKKFIGKED